MVQGTMKMLQLVSDDAEKRLKQNPKLCKRATGGPDETRAPIVMGQLQVTPPRLPSPPIASSLTCSPPHLLVSSPPRLLTSYRLLASSPLRLPTP